MSNSLTTTASNAANLRSLDIVLQLLDNGVALLEVLVQTVALGNQLLLPGSESLLLNLDLLGKALPQSLLLFLELGVVQLARSCLAELASLHLLAAVSLVVVLFGGVDQVEHVCADKDSAKLLEVAVLLVLNLGNAPCVLTALDSASVGGGHILFAANNREGHGVDEGLSVLHGWLVVFLEWGLVDFDSLSINDAADLGEVVSVEYECG